jgi:hypothetical protein
MDEVTGFEFLYMDLNHDLFDNARSSEDPSPEDVSGIMYARYSAASLSSNEIALAERGISERDIKYYWENCLSLISGFCSNAHVQVWTGTLSAFGTAVGALLLTVKANDKLNQSPRSACVNYGKDNLCVSWAAYYPSSMTDKQIREVAEACAYECAAYKQSCEARVVAVDVIQYYCVSDRADGCTANKNIKRC